MNVVLYIHGKGGSAKEAEHYKSLFPDCYVSGLDYKTFSARETGKEIHKAITKLKTQYDKITIIANSIGAFFCMNADIDELIHKAYFISPIVDIEKLITDMMKTFDITEVELEKKGVIQTDIGEELSWKYLLYVREHPLKWNVPTEILYGDMDVLTAYETIVKFARIHNAHLTVMKNGEHWFHTVEQMKFLDNWIKSSVNNF